MTVLLGCRKNFLLSVFLLGTLQLAVQHPAFASSDLVNCGSFANISGTDPNNGALQHAVIQKLVEKAHGHMRNGSLDEAQMAMHSIEDALSNPQVVAPTLSREELREISNLKSLVMGQLEKRRLAELESDSTPNPRPHPNEDMSPELLRCAKLIKLGRFPAAKACLDGAYELAESSGGSLGPGHLHSQTYLNLILELNTRWVEPNDPIRDATSTPKDVASLRPQKAGRLIKVGKSEAPVVPKKPPPKPRIRITAIPTDIHRFDERQLYDFFYANQILESPNGVDASLVRELAAFHAKLFISSAYHAMETAIATDSARHLHDALAPGLNFEPFAAWTEHYPKDSPFTPDVWRPLEVPSHFSDRVQTISQLRAQFPITSSEQLAVIERFRKRLESR